MVSKVDQEYAGHIRSLYQVYSLYNFGGMKPQKTSILWRVGYVCTGDGPTLLHQMVSNTGLLHNGHASHWSSAIFKMIFCFVTCPPAFLKITGLLQSL